MDEPFGEPFTFATDPMIVLMQQQCESAADELELASYVDQRESVLLSAAFQIVNNRRN